MTLFVILMLFVLGACIGSFLNVVIYRTLHDESFVRGRSHCESCGTLIHWYDNVPLLSYLVLKGRCRACKTKISIQHPVIEFMTGILFVWWYVVGFAFFRLTTLPFSVVQPLFWLVIGVILWLIFVTDVLHMLMPTPALVIMPLLAFLYRWSLAESGIMEWHDFWWAILMGVLLSLFLWSLRVLTKGKGMGDGDVIFALSMGFLLGWPRALVGMFLAFLIGAVVGVGIIVLKKKRFSSRIPFGPFLILGTFLALLWGDELWGWYMQWL